MGGNGEPYAHAFARSGEMQPLRSRIVARRCYLELHLNENPQAGCSSHLTIGHTPLSSPARPCFR